MQVCHTSLIYVAQGRMSTLIIQKQDQTLQQMDEKKNILKVEMKEVTYNLHTYSVQFCYFVLGI